MSKDDDLEKTKALMRSLVLAPPRLHDDMKLGKKRAVKKRVRRKKKQPGK